MEWLPVHGYEGHYEVSDTGIVRTVCGLILVQCRNDQGYALVRLSRPRALARVHRLVAQAFILNPDGKPSVNHIDCVRDNNNRLNLEWCTQLENIQHSDRLGRMQRNHWKGKRPPSAALTDEQVRSVRELYATGKYSWATLGKQFGISKRSIGRAISGETYANV